MRFTPSTAFTVYAKGHHKYLEWKCYARKTSTINTALGSGSWTEVTDYVVGIPDFPTGLEFHLGQPAMDVITITGRNIAYWQNNILNPGAGERVEVKWTCQIGLGASKLASDLAYVFAGWVKMDSIAPTNFNDMLTFDVFSQESIGQDLPGEILTTQYVEDDVEGDNTGTNGLILDKIPGLYLTNAAVTSYLLHAGVHTITYSYNGGSEVARLDDGSDTALGTGTTTLVNGDGDQKVQVYIRSMSDLWQSDDLTQEIVVTNSGDTLPKQWYRRVAVRNLLKTIYAQIGIDTITFDTLEMATNDSSAKVSFLDQPPGDLSVTGYKWAMATDGTDLFIGVGHKVYKRTMASDAYTLMATLTSGDRISKLFYNARNGHLWIFYGNNIDGEGKVRRLAVSGPTLSSEVTVSGSSRSSCQLYDYEYSAGSFEYCFLYVDNSNRAVKRVDGSTLAVTTLFTAADLGYGVGEGPNLGFSYLRAGARYGFSAADATYGYYHEIYVDALGVWTDDGQASTDVPDPTHTVASYDADEDKIYYWSPVDSKVKVMDRTGTSATDVLTLSAGDLVYNMLFANSKTYLTTHPDGDIYSLESSTATLLSSSPDVTTKWNTLTWLNSRLYGIDPTGRLFQLHTSLAFYVDTARYSGKDVHQSLNDTLNAFLLLACTSTIKEARVYRRGNDDGDAQTSGNTFAATTAEIADFSKNAYAFPAFDWVEVSNGTVTHSYDGTNFDEDLTIQGRRLTISNELIPDEIVLDLAYWLYQYFATDRDLYTVETSIVPLFNYEAFDGFSATLTDQYLAETISGLIVGQTLRANGSMQLQVVAPL
jgi:hypothetical protein